MNRVFHSVTNYLRAMQWIDLSFPSHRLGHRNISIQLLIVLLQIIFFVYNSEMKAIHNFNKINYIIEDTQVNEFIFFHFNDTNLNHIDQSKIEKFKILSERTSKLFTYLNTLNFKECFESGKDWLHHSKWISFPLQIGSGQVLKSQRIFSNVDSQSIETYQEQLKIFEKPEMLIPTFKLVGDKYQLGPTIQYMFEKFNLEFAFIDPASNDNNQMLTALREAFEYLRLRGFKKTLYFSFNDNFDKWNAKTFNTYSGMKNIHMDLSNKCTHSCVFCGLWGPDFIDAMKKEQGGNLSADTKKFMNMQISRDRALAIIHNAPETVNSVQLGGAGDPLTHPHWLEIIAAWRTRGVKTEVLSNFEYPSFNEILEIHKLSRGSGGITFFVNISAVTAETYIKVRPRQNEETFNRVISNLFYLSKLKEKDHFGSNIILINIINSLNFHEVVEMVRLGSALRAQVWLKPLEIHNDIHKKFSIGPGQMKQFKTLLQEALDEAKRLNVTLIAEEFATAIINQPEA
jgi:wyosine [tRNA(Phe)-imidazoG37] synthetase (radical SAM superfamily)